MVKIILVRLTVIVFGAVMLVSALNAKTPTPDGGPIPLCGPNCVWQWGHCYCTY